MLCAVVVLELAGRHTMVFPGGGILVTRRGIMLEVPIHPRMVGWAQTTRAWRWPCFALNGPGWRGHGDLLHLWHPPALRNDRWIGNGHNWALCLRYAATRHDTAAMLALIAEAHRMLQHRTYEAGGLS